jgi:hypothetical protein
MQPPNRVRNLAVPQRPGGVLAVLALAALILSGVGNASAAEAEGAAYYADGMVKGKDKDQLLGLFGEATQAAKDAPDKALEKLGEALKLDPNNANLYYLCAAAYATKGDWVRATTALQNGGKCRECYRYVNVTGSQRLQMNTQHYALWRDLARNAAAGGEAALLAVRGVGMKTMEELPRDVLACLAGIAVVAIADGAIIEFCQKANRADEARVWFGRRDADRRWGEETKQAVNSAMAEGTRRMVLDGVDQRLLAPLVDGNAPPPPADIPQAERQKFETAMERYTKDLGTVVAQCLAKRPK